MKNLNKIFYDILISLDKEQLLFARNTDLLKKYFFTKGKTEEEKMLKLAEYLRKFKDFCFDLDVNIMLNGSIDFKYR